MSTVYVTGDSLYHFGVLGMKWGVRRYQNKDGTLTDEGKKRYKTVDNFNRVRAAKKAKIKDIAKRTTKRVVTTAAAITAGRFAVGTILGIVGGLNMYDAINSMSPGELSTLDAIFKYKLKRDQLGVKPIELHEIVLPPR